MKTRYIKLIGILSALIALFSCEQVIDLKLNSPERKLVVEGRIEKAKKNTISRQTIKLSVISDFFDSSTPPAATGAVLWVNSDQGTRYDFQETEDGLYVHEDLIAESGVNYTLNIVWEGQEFQGMETLIEVPAIDSIYQLSFKSNLFEDAGIKVALDFTDPDNEENFYLWETYIDGDLVVLPDPGNKFNLIAKDDFFDGQLVDGYLPNEEVIIDPGSMTTVKQLALSQNAFTYYYSIFDQAGKNGSILDTPPAAIRGNIVNLTHPEDYPLGYFYATEVDDATIVIEEE